MADLLEDQRLIDISPKAYEHPADRAATAALQAIPMMDTVVRKLIEFGEGSVRQQLLAGAVRLGDDQLSEVWAGHRAALARLDIHEVPDLYMWQMPITNAMAIGRWYPSVSRSSRSPSATAHSLRQSNVSLAESCATATRHVPSHNRHTPRVTAANDLALTKRCSGAVLPDRRRRHCGRTQMRSAPRAPSDHDARRV